MPDPDYKALCSELVDVSDNPSPPQYKADVLNRAARRPKPPSLKEQALAVLDDCADRLDGAHENTIRRALEALPSD